MTDAPDPYPDSPVTRVEIEHDNGTVKRLTGDEATSWTRCVDAAVSEATIRGRDMPTDVGWETWKSNREGDDGG